MPRRFTTLAWAAAVCTYLLIVLGAVVRITGSGLGCGEHWPLCNGHVFPPLNDIGTVIEWSHRLVAALVTMLVTALAAYGWLLRRGARSGEQVALGLLVVQVLLGAITVKLSLPPWTVILHLGTAMLLLATLILAAKLTPGASPGNTEPPITPGSRPGLVGIVALVLGFVTVLFGALTANLGAASACLGFPLCNGQVIPTGNYLQLVQWVHRLLAYMLFTYVVWWAVSTKRRGAWYVVGLVTLQVVVAATMVLLALPPPLQAAHVAVGAAGGAGLGP